MKELMKWKPQKELILVGGTLLWMWISYYTDQKLLPGNLLFTMIGSVFMTMIVNCVVIPVWWVAVHQKEGLKGLNITKDRIGLALLFTIALGAWRFLELRPYLGTENLVSTLLFNGLAIWEVLFIFGWMFTRFEKSFGKIPAVLLTTVCVGIYHLGSLTGTAILHLCLVILICSICYCITENIFMFWPIYWTIGCSASTLESGMVFPTEVIGLCVVILLVQIGLMLLLGRKGRRAKKCRN